MARELTRRQALATTAGAGLVLSGCGGGRSGATTGAGTIGGPIAAGQCLLTPEQAEGPFYVPDRLLRRDITDGRPGVPLELALTVRSADACRPLPGATVEIWHCDAHGAYSGFDAEGSDERSRFLRGGQRTDRRGLAVFRTIYPGWYEGRTPHVHVKVYAGGDDVHTGQLYFPDATTRAVHRRPPYSSRGRPPVRNADDGIYSRGGRQSTLSLTRSGSGHVGRLSLVVRT